MSMKNAISSIRALDFFHIDMQEKLFITRIANHLPFDKVAPVYGYAK